MKKTTTELIKMYKRRRFDSFGGLVVSVMLIVFAVKFSIDYPQALALEISIMLGMAAIFIVLFFIMLTYYNCKIKKLEAEEDLEEKEKEEKDEKIKELEEKVKELEEALNNAKNDGN